MTSLNRKHQRHIASPSASQLNYRHVFTDLTCPQRERLKQRAISKKLKRRTHLYHIGSKANEIYLVGDGLIMLSSLFTDGREIGQVILPQGNLFGEQEIINNTTRIHQATAVTDCKIWVIKEADFLCLAKSTPEFSIYLVKIMSARLQRSELRLGYFSSHDVAQRLTQLLLELVDAEGCQDGSGLYLSPCPTHCELSTLLVTTRETISLVMGELRRKKIISFDRRKLHILDKSALAQY